MPSTQLEDQTKAAVMRARVDPIWFMENILNVKTTAQDARRGQSWDLDIWQRELYEAFADIERFKLGLPTKVNHEGKSKITIRAMHGPGKTFGVAGLMHLFNFCYKGTIVATAPKEKQLRTRLWPAFRKLRNRASKAYASLMKVDTTKITWCGDEDWVAHAETASEPENLAGFHDDYLLFIVDEASGMKEEMFPVIEGAVSTGYLVIVILIGNPTKNIGTFYDSHMKPKVSQHYYKMHVDLNKTNRVSRDWVKQMEDKYGVNSPVVKVRCYGEFAEMGENQLYALSWILAAREREFVDDGSVPYVRVSIDVSDGGEDETVITAARVYATFTHLLKQTRHSWSTAIAVIEAAKEGVKMFERFGGKKESRDDFVVDSLGVGAGTAGALLDMGHRVVVYKGGSASDNPNKWRCRRVQSHIVTRDNFRDGEFTIDDDFLDDSDWDDFCAQMCSIQSKVGMEKVEDLITKKEMKALGIKSPDQAESVIMISATQIPTLIKKSNAAIEALGQMESNFNESF